MILHFVPGGRVVPLFTFFVDDFGNEMRSWDYEPSRVFSRWTIPSVVMYFTDQDH